MISISKKILSSIFIVLESIFFILIHFVSYDKFAYLSIIICFVFGILICIIEKKFKFGVVALFFTCVADLFLVVLDRYIIGVLFFILVQTFWFFEIFVKISIDNKKIKIIGIEKAIVFVLNLLVVLFSLLNPDAYLYIISGVYFINLLINTVASTISKKWVMLCGFVLFIACDICVGLHEIDLISFQKVNWSWLFYLPSQTLLVLSLINKTNYKINA